MSLELRMGRNGVLRPMWYGRFEVDGKRSVVNLGVKIGGKPPESLSLRDEGDGAFERSRAHAQAKLDQVIEESRRKHDAAHLVERMYELKTGEPIQSVKLADLAEEWTRIPRRRPPEARYAAQCRSTLNRFVDFVRDRNTKADELGHITRQMARSFLDAEASRGVTSKTWNDTLKLLRATCKYLLPGGSINPFTAIPTRETETIFRKPFNPDELKAILDAARTDDFVRPVLVTAICTAMRRGDCCLLRWSDVDLTKRFITVKTAKTGATVAIPIFPLLYEELAHRTRSTSDFVFPRAASMYKENPSGITHRVRKVFEDAGFKDAGGDETTGVAQDMTAPFRGEIHAERKQGLRRASVRDFHSFRVTWVTLALTAGVPLELVQKVTGHKTVDVVLKHYFQPGREEFRNALQSAMPKLLTNGSKSVKEQMLDILKETTEQTWKVDVIRLRELVASLS